MAVASPKAISLGFGGAETGDSPGAAPAAEALAAATVVWLRANPVATAQHVQDGSSVQRCITLPAKEMQTLVYPYIEKTGGKAMAERVHRMRRRIGNRKSKSRRDQAKSNGVEKTKAAKKTAEAVLALCTERLYQTTVERAAAAAAATDAAGLPTLLAEEPVFGLPGDGAQPACPPKPRPLVLSVSIV